MSNDSTIEFKTLSMIIEIILAWNKEIVYIILITRIINKKIKKSIFINIQQVISNITCNSYIRSIALARAYIKTNTDRKLNYIYANHMFIKKTHFYNKIYFLAIMIAGSLCVSLLEIIQTWFLKVYIKKKKIQKQTDDKSRVWVLI